MISQIEEYFSQLYCPAVAKACVRPLIYSAVIHKFIPLEKVSRFRYRLNVMLHWEFGYWKSTILNQVRSWMPLETNILTTSSAAALRGSFIENKFMVPELLLNDILVIPEFSTISSGDDDVLGNMNIALEDAEIRVALIKAGRLPPSEISKIESFGATFENERLCYRNQCVVWTATHTIDNISNDMRDALLSRFYICYVPLSEIPAVCGYNDQTELTDLVLENEITAWLKPIIERESKPDHHFCRQVTNILKINSGTERKRPREVQDLRRMILAHREIYPEDSPETVAGIMMEYFSIQGGQTTRELIANLIFDSPHTIVEIVNETGSTKANCFNHLKRLGALHIGSNPTKYYLNQTHTSGGVN